ncbi:MAG: type IV pilus secretin PilQ [Desulfobacterales bacterium]|uniref:Type IV pilus secretin PilQ n=1 Tax=Candidatus Desulfatibia profunda TaxID=2841695 RepID=A0A8J6NNC2_9BACT|nr:type IV pilus secretin PilQ [Candidatus Desulfatibia profunda]MBL7179503.1 type IV pilus secretin PilQ [Desulfobacterales bacterium]
MKCEINKLLKIGTTAFFILIVVILFAGCASKQMAAKQSDKGVVEPLDPKLITQITTAEDSESFIVWVKGNRMLTYTSVKQPFPLGVLIYFPETVLGSIDTTYNPESDVVGPINVSELTDSGHTARIEISLKKDTSYEVTREDNGLRISFKKASEALTPADQTVKTEEKKPVAESEKASAKTDTTAATRLESISSIELENGTNIFINADGTVIDYKSFTTNNPPRIVFDLFNVTSSFKTEQTVPVNSKWVKSVRHYGYPDRLRVVLDTTDRYLAAFSAKPSENGLVIQVGSETQTVDKSEPVEERAEIAAKEMTTSEVAAASQVAAAPEAPKISKVNNSKPAWVNRIDFSSEEAGKSTIIIGTTKPIKYKLKKIQDNKLLLDLYNTNIPEYRQRPLITTRFESAVDRITPFQTPKMKNNSMIAIEMREALPYTVEQVDDLLMLHFQASSISPKTLDEAKLPSWKKVIAQVIAETETAEPEAVAGMAAEPTPSGKYTGEKIALNFYETDIKNVFRILMDVSRKNFAVDKDVSGKVTLTFDKPVPWDQVLDLVLKMNGLGMVYEGDIVRIATLTTLEQEASRRQAMLASDQKLEDQKKALQPLVTEFIPVNYANASADIKPHIDIIVTEGRGKVSVDARNNQIIITDTAEKVKLAKETVKQIDKVTSQVLIEAKIVDADKSFSRYLGTQWQLTGTPTSDTHNAWAGGELGFDMSATNPPTSTLGELGLSFTRLAGSKISIVNAKLMASESDSLTKVISSPKILTLDNTAATIKQGIKYPYNKLDADGNTVTEFFDVALELQVTPHVTSDSRISMKIQLTNNDIGNVYNNQQSFKTKEAKTELLVNDGDTVIIGGIRYSKKTEDVGGVPGLKDIPLLGWLFKSKGKKDESTELLIFITPRIIQLEQRNTS